MKSYRDRFSKNSEISNSIKIRTVTAKLLQADRHDVDNSRFFAILRLRLKMMSERRNWTPNLVCCYEN